MFSRPNRSSDVIHNLSQFRSVLDIGCGYAPIIGAVKAPCRVGVDLSDIPLSIAMQRHPDVTFIRRDVRELTSLFMPQAFDASVGFDILEHLTKAEGLQVLEDVDYLARYCSWWFMPAGFMEIVDEDITDGNFLMYHKSGWEPEDLAERGYEVWHYADWFKKRKNDQTSIRGMFACKTRPGCPFGTNPGAIHNLNRFVNGHDTAERPVLDEKQPKSKPKRKMKKKKRKKGRA
jgi:SAM-dependent methyltransferase